METFRDAWLNAADLAHSSLTSRLMWAWPCIGTLDRRRRYLYYLRAELATVPDPGARRASYPSREGHRYECVDDRLCRVDETCNYQPFGEHTRVRFR